MELLLKNTNNMKLIFLKTSLIVLISNLDFVGIHKSKIIFTGTILSYIYCERIAILLP